VKLAKVELPKQVLYQLLRKTDRKLIYYRILAGRRLDKLKSKIM